MSRLNTTEANADMARNLEHWRHEVGKLHSQVDRRDHEIQQMRNYRESLELDNNRLTALVADLTAANAALAADNARLGKRVDALRTIADLTEVNAHEFARKYPELNKQLNDTDMERWGDVLSELAARAWRDGGDA